MNLASKRLVDDRPKSVVEWTVRDFKTIQHATPPLLNLNAAGQASAFSSRRATMVIAGQAIDLSRRGSDRLQRTLVSPALAMPDHDRSRIQPLAICAANTRQTS